MAGGGDGGGGGGDRATSGAAPGTWASLRGWLLAPSRLVIGALVD